MHPAWPAGEGKFWRRTAGAVDTRIQISASHSSSWLPRRRKRPCVARRSICTQGPSFWLRAPAARPALTLAVKQPVSLHAPGQAGRAGAGGQRGLHRDFSFSWFFAVERERLCVAQATVRPAAVHGQARVTLFIHPHTSHTHTLTRAGPTFPPTRPRTSPGPPPPPRRPAPPPPAPPPRPHQPTRRRASWPAGPPRRGQAGRGCT